MFPGNVASPSRSRKPKDSAPVKTCRTFEQLHADFAPGQPVLLDGPIMYKYQALNTEGICIYYYIIVRKRYIIKRS